MFNAELRDPQAVLDAIEAPIVIYDSGQRFLLANRAYHDFFPEMPGESELRGRHFSEILSLKLEIDSLSVPILPEERTAFIAHWMEALREGGESREFFDRRHRKWYRLNLSLAPGGLTVAMRTDIDAQKRLQQEMLWEREAALAALRRLKEATAATLAAAEGILHRLQAAQARRDALPPDALAGLREQFTALAAAAGLSPAAPEPPPD